MSISNNIAVLPTLPPFSYITDERLGSVDVNEADVLRYLRRVNIHKSYNESQPFRRSWKLLAKVLSVGN
jgi:hypothetical protein